MFITRSLAGESLVKLDARGRFIEAKVSAGVAEALRNSPFLVSADAGSFFSDKGLKNLLAQAIPTLPGKPVDSESAWATDLEMAVPPIKIVLQYKEKLASLTGEAARLDALIQTSIVPEANVSATIKSQSGTRNARLRHSTRPYHRIDRQANTRAEDRRREPRDRAGDLARHAR